MKRSPGKIRKSVVTKIVMGKNESIDFQRSQSVTMKQKKRKKRGKSTVSANSNAFDIVGVIGSSPTNPTPRSLE